MIQFSKRASITAVLMGLISLILFFQNCANYSQTVDFSNSTLGLGNNPESLASTGQIIIHNPPSRFASNKQVTIDFSFSGTGAENLKFFCKLDSSPEFYCIKQAAFLALDDGFHEFSVRALDKQGGEVAVNSLTWLTDSVPPAITAHQTPAAITGDKNLLLSFTLLDTFDVFPTSECQLDIESWVPCTSPYIRTDIEPGNHTVRVRSKDNKNNVSVGLSYSWVISTDIPYVAFSTTPNNISLGGSMTFNFKTLPENREDYPNFECKLSNENNFSPCESGRSYSNLTEGSYSFTVRAKNANGDLTSNLTFNFIVDTSIPTISIVTPSNNDEVDAEQFVLQVATDDGDGSGVSTLLCQVNGSVFSICPQDLNFNNLDGGIYEISVKAVDHAGRYSIPKTVGPVYYFKERPTLSFTHSSATISKSELGFSEAYKIEVQVTGDNLKPIAAKLISTDDVTKNLTAAKPLSTGDVNRFDWDYQFVNNGAITIGAFEDAGRFEVIFSDDSRNDIDRVLNLKIDSNALVGDINSMLVSLPDYNEAPAQEEVTFSSLMEEVGGVFANNCISCHNSSNFINTGGVGLYNGGLDMTDYRSMVSNGIIKPGLPAAESKLFSRLKPAAGSGIQRMPPNQALKDNEIKKIEDWLNAGAKNN